MLPNDPLSLDIRNAPAGSKESTVINEPDLHSFALLQKMGVIQALADADGFTTLASVLSADRVTWLVSKPLQGRASLLLSQVITSTLLTVMLIKCLNMHFSLIPSVQFQVASRVLEGGILALNQEST